MFLGHTHTHHDIGGVGLGGVAFRVDELSPEAILARQVSQHIHSVVRFLGAVVVVHHKAAEGVAVESVGTPIRLLAVIASVPLVAVAISLTHIHRSTHPHTSIIHTSIIHTSIIHTHHTSYT